MKGFDIDLKIVIFFVFDDTETGSAEEQPVRDNRRQKRL